MAMPGTPLAEEAVVDVFQLVRLIAVTRIALPKARVRLAAGRTRLSREGQALCFFAGANSIFYGDKLLTAENPAADADVTLLRELGLNIGGTPRSTTDTNGPRRDELVSSGGEVFKAAKVRTTQGRPSDCD
jgi:biotin synthase